VADRLRPDDRMVAHTGFLVFARYMEPPAARPRTEAAAAPDEAPAVEAEDLPDAPAEADGPDDTES
jgi:tRNA (adenine57-N1/adenine58-N1)-methyltransferase